MLFFRRIQLRNLQTHAQGQQLSWIGFMILLFSNTFPIVLMSLLLKMSSTAWKERSTEKIDSEQWQDWNWPRKKFFFVFAPRIRCELYCNSKFFPHCEHYDDAKSSYVDTEMFSLDFSQVLRSQLILDLCYPLLVIPNCCIFIMYFHLSGL